MADVIVIADEDDVGIERAVEVMSHMGLDLVWLPLGVLDTACNLQITPGGAPVVEMAGARLDGEVFEDAQFVLFHRWHQGRVPVVRSSLTDSAQRAFAEREWEGAVHAVLLAFERRHPGVVWSLPSSGRSAVASRHELLSIAADVGLTVPSWLVSTDSASPASLGDPLVAKPVNLWERVSERLLFGTSRIPATVAKKAITESSPTPVYLQRLVPRQTEWRIYFVFGSALCVEMSGKDLPVDIRNARPGDVLVRLIECPKSLLSAISTFTAALGLGFCVFDFVIAEDGTSWLVDVTHNGSWDHLETNPDPWLSEAIAGAIVKVVEKEAAA